MTQAMANDLELPQNAFEYKRKESYSSSTGATAEQLKIIQLRSVNSFSSRGNEDSFSMRQGAEVTPQVVLCWVRSSNVVFINQEVDNTTTGG